MMRAVARILRPRSLLGLRCKGVNQRRTKTSLPTPARLQARAAKRLAAQSRVEEEEHELSNIDQGTLEEILDDDDFEADTAYLKDMRDEVDGGCVAYCNHESFDMYMLREYLKADGLGDGSKVVTYKVGGEIDAIHVRVYEEDDAPSSHSFFFPSGASVFWGIAEPDRERILGNISRFGKASKPFSLDGRAVMDEKTREAASQDRATSTLFGHDFQCRVVPDSKTKFREDVVMLSSWDNVLELLAVSYGLAQSTKLSMYERTLEGLIDRTGDLPRGLSEDAIIQRKLDLRSINRLVAELLEARFDINIRSDILDTPYIIWEFPELEGVYEQCVREVQLNKRRNLVNKRMDIIKETLEVLNNERQNRIGHNLEKYIIALIAVEILLEIKAHLYHLPS